MGPEGRLALTIDSGELAESLLANWRSKLRCVSNRESQRPLKHDDLGETDPGSLSSMLDPECSSTYTVRSVRSWPDFPSSLPELSAGRARRSPCDDRIRSPHARTVRPGLCEAVAVLLMAVLLLAVPAVTLADVPLNSLDVVRAESGQTLGRHVAQGLQAGTVAGSYPSRLECAEAVDAASGAPADRRQAHHSRTGMWSAIAPVGPGRMLTLGKTPSNMSSARTRALGAVSPVDLESGKPASMNLWSGYANSYWRVKSASSGSDYTSPWSLGKQPVRKEHRDPNGHLGRSDYSAPNRLFWSAGAPTTRIRPDGSCRGDSIRSDIRTPVPSLCNSAWRDSTTYRVVRPGTEQQGDTQPVDLPAVGDLSSSKGNEPPPDSTTTTASASFANQRSPENDPLRTPDRTGNCDRTRAALESFRDTSFARQGQAIEQAVTAVRASTDRVSDPPRSVTESGSDVSGITLVNRAVAEVRLAMVNAHTCKTMVVQGDGHRATVHVPENLVPSPDQVAAGSTKALALTPALTVANATTVRADAGSPMSGRAAVRVPFGDGRDVNAQDGRLRVAVASNSNWELDREIIAEWGAPDPTGLRSRGVPGPVFKGIGGPQPRDPIRGPPGWPGRTNRARPGLRNAYGSRAAGGAAESATTSVLEGTRASVGTTYRYPEDAQALAELSKPDVRDSGVNDLGLQVALAPLEVLRAGRSGFVDSRLRIGLELPGPEMDHFSSLRELGGGQPPSRGHKAIVKLRQHAVAAPTLLRRGRIAVDQGAADGGVGASWRELGGGSGIHYRQRREGGAGALPLTVVWEPANLRRGPPICRIRCATTASERTTFFRSQYSWSRPDT